MTLNSIREYLQSITSPFCLILVGAPLSGKDTFIRELDIENLGVISRDDIILELSPQMNYNLAWNSIDQKLVDKTLKSRVNQYSGENKNIIINLTNLRKKGRKSFLLKFGNNYKKIAIIFPVLSIEDYQKRNYYRTETEGKTIPMKVIQEMIEGYEPIDDTENFDNIINYTY